MYKRAQRIITTTGSSLSLTRTQHAHTHTHTKPQYNYSERELSEDNRDRGHCVPLFTEAEPSHTWQMADGNPNSSVRQYDSHDTLSHTVREAGTHTQLGKSSKLSSRTKAVSLKHPSTVFTSCKIQGLFSSSLSFRAAGCLVVRTLGQLPKGCWIESSS